MRKNNSKRFESIILNILKKQDKVHYTYVARVLEVSPSYARDIMRGMAEFYPYLSYEQGYLIMEKHTDEPIRTIEEVDKKLHSLMKARPVE